MKSFLGKQELVSEIEKTIKHLEGSEDSIWSDLTAQETKEVLERELTKIRNGLDFDKLELAVLFAPTGNVQEIAMHNGWHKEYLEIADVIDKNTDDIS